MWTESLLFRQIITIFLTAVHFSNTICHQWSALWSPFLCPSVLYPFVLLYLPLFAFPSASLPCSMFPSSSLLWSLSLRFFALRSFPLSSLLLYLAVFLLCHGAFCMFCYSSLCLSDLLSFPRRSARLTSSCLCSDPSLSYPPLICSAFSLSGRESLLPCLYSDSSYLCFVPFLSYDFLLAIHLFSSPLSSLARFSSILWSSWPSY